jgi:hypothetical protein
VGRAVPELEGVGDGDAAHSAHRVHDLKIARQAEPGTRNSPGKNDHRPGLNKMEAPQLAQGKKDAPDPQRSQ